MPFVRSFSDVFGRVYYLNGLIQCGYEYEILPFVLFAAMMEIFVDVGCKTGHVLNDTIHTLTAFSEVLHRCGIHFCINSHDSSELGDPDEVKCVNEMCNV